MLLVSRVWLVFLIVLAAGVLLGVARIWLRRHPLGR
jgi:hypothetical protein